MISNDIIQTFYRSIDFVAQNIQCYCQEPVSDFTRKRKLPVNVLMDCILQMQAKSTQSELCSYFHANDSLPSASAFCQQRNKLDPEAFKRSNDLFIHAFNNYKTWKGYHILACDGSDVNIPFDPKDKETFQQNGDSKPFSQYHINGIYDCLNRIFWDVHIDTATKTRECDALQDMIKYSNYPNKSILTCDRGYEKYNLIATCQRYDQKFVIRTKDIHSSRGILSNLNLPDGEFDIDIKKILTRKQTNEVKTDKEKYTFITNKSEFDYFDEEGFYEMDLRVVRFKITEDTYECLITNLTREEFSLEDLKELYHLRWSIENGFRELKYTVGMLYFHSKKRRHIQQEIYARIFLYNLTNILINHVSEEKKDTVHRYKVNFSTAVTNLREYLAKRISIETLIERIKKYLAPIRPDRKYKRKMKPQSVIPLTYKAS